MEKYIRFPRTLSVVEAGVLCPDESDLQWFFKLGLDRELVANEIGCPKYPNFVGNRKFDVKSMGFPNLVKIWDL